MKKILLVMLALLLIKCSNLKYLNAYNGLKGKPKMIESTTYKINFIDSLENEIVAFKIMFHFDSKGRILKHPHLNKDGTLGYGETKYIYDKKGNVVEYIRYGKDSFVNIQNKYEYNKYGKLLKRESYFNGNIKAITKYNYDINNREARIIMRNSDGSFRDNALEKYDRNWNDTELISYDSLGNQKSRIEFEYDKRGNKYLYKYYSSKNELYKISKTIFNEYNDPIWASSLQFSSKDTTKGKVTEFKYLYDTKNNSIEEKSIVNGKTVWITRNNIMY